MSEPKDQDWSQIRSSLVNEVKGIRNDLFEYAKEQKEHREIIYGNPMANKRGFSERLNKLEDEYKDRKSHQNWIWVAVLTSFIERASHYIFHWGK